MKRLRNRNGTLDNIDVKILHSLADNSRMTMVQLATATGLSPPSVAERLKRLEEVGVIRDYTITVDPALLGLPVAAWIRIRPMPGQLKRVAEILRDMPEVVECDRITGEDCFIARAHVGSIAELEALVDQVISYAITNTSLIQSSPVPRRLPPIATQCSS